MFQFSAKSLDLQKEIKAFIQEVVVPGQKIYAAQQQNNTDRWAVPEHLEVMKRQAKAANLWNMFLSSDQGGAGLNNFDYAPLAEMMGKYPLSSEVFNCAAPDTGNMEVIHRYGNHVQKQRWLQPLLDGSIRSAFAMTEPGVASSDATNISLSAVRDGDEYVLNGEKWWTSGAGDPRCKILIVMCVTNPDAPKHSRQSQILVPLDTPGVHIERMLTVLGYDGAPHGHAHLKFNNVRVSHENILLGEGKGFEIAQGRLGPGRIHHCMRFIGVAERALELMCERAQSRTAFGKRISELGANYDYIAESRIEIEMARLLTLNAAAKMDQVGNKQARNEIAQIKVVAPSMALKVIDRAIQIHGACGVSQDTPLAQMWANTRTIRIGDGPDEVHRRTVARMELGNYPDIA